MGRGSRDRRGSAGRQRLVTAAAAAVVLVASACSTHGSSSDDPSTSRASPRASASATHPSGVAMPVGNLPGWKQVFTEDFDSTVKLGSWPGPYRSKLNAYSGGPDTAKVGEWNAKTTLSAAHGMADYYLHTVDGVPQCAALLPRTKPQTYGRYSVRFKVDDPLAGYASAWLLFPDDAEWPAHGEIDWPEGELDKTMSLNNHYANPQGGVDSIDTGVEWSSGWHTATTVWEPGSVTSYLDGQLVATSTTQVSSYPMHWVLQSETAYGVKPAADVAGHIQIDWLVQYERA